MNPARWKQVADLFHVNIQTAPLLELALGDCVGHVVIRREAEILEHLIAQHDSGVRDYSSPIWTLLMFDAYLRNAMEGREPAHALREAV